MSTDALKSSRRATARTYASSALQYVEGFASDGVARALPYGWIEVHGKVVDLTWKTDAWEHRGEPCGPFGGYPAGVLPSGYAYLGVAVDRDHIRRRREKRGRMWALLGDYEGRFPMLRVSVRVGATALPHPNHETTGGER